MPKTNFGLHWSFNILNDPKRFSFVLSRYDFSAKMMPFAQSVLELGCSEGIGLSTLIQNKASYTGVDLDRSAIESACINFPNENCRFIYDDFMGKSYGSFDGVVSLDVVEHIHPEYEGVFFQTLVKNMKENGICIVGTPNITASPYASKASQIGHVNLFSQERLNRALEPYFDIVLNFGMNDELVHTGYGPMSHYLFCVGCGRKS